MSEAQLSCLRGISLCASFHIQAVLTDAYLTLIRYDTQSAAFAKVLNIKDEMSFGRFINDVDLVTNGSLLLSIKPDGKRDCC